MRRPAIKPPCEWPERVHARASNQQRLSKGDDDDDEQEEDGQSSEEETTTAAAAETPEHIALVDLQARKTGQNSDED